MTEIKVKTSELGVRVSRSVQLQLPDSAAYEITDRGRTLRVRSLQFRYELSSNGDWRKLFGSQGTYSQRLKSGSYGAERGSSYMPQAQWIEDLAEQHKPRSVVEVIEHD